MRFHKILLATAILTQVTAPGAELATTTNRLLSDLQIQAWASGLASDQRLQMRAVHRESNGKSHVHLNRFYKGIRVWDGDFVGHVDKSGFLQSPTGLRALPIDIDIQARITQDDALKRFSKQLAMKGELARAPEAELVLFPAHRFGSAALVHLPRNRFRLDETFWSPRPPTSDYVLSYRLHFEYENAQDGVIHRDALIDAKTGALLMQWNSLYSMDNQGHSLYSGDVTLQVDTSTNANQDEFVLRDISRPTLANPLTNVIGNETRNMRFASGGIGELFSDVDGVWGDGLPFDYISTSNSENGQTVGVDAHYGLQATWDFYSSVFGRNGIDDKGTSTFNRTHFLDRFFFNAFWSDGCFCMSYGDGGAYSLTPLDVAGHEMSHGVMAAEANLDYFDESGGLNEANSDILGTMTEFHARGGKGPLIGQTGGNWTLGEQIGEPPLRFMYKPSLDGISYDVWFDGIGIDDVHYSSGPANRMFYFLSQGASNSGDTQSELMPDGFSGIGNDKAAAIWYRAISMYMTSSSDYQQARVAALQAAHDLFGSSSIERFAVQNAFAAIGVGTAADQIIRPEIRFDNFPLSTSLANPYIAVVPTGVATRFAAQDRNNIDSVLNWTAEDTSTGESIAMTGGSIVPAKGFSTLLRLIASAPTQALAMAQRFVVAVELDINDDNTLDPEDIGALALVYGTDPNGESAYPLADISGNGFVNDVDLSLYAEAFFKVFSP